MTRGAPSRKGKYAVDLRVLQSLPVLTNEEREAFVDSFIVGLTQPVIARRLGVTKQSISLHGNRATEKLAADMRRRGAA